MIPWRGSIGVHDHLRPKGLRIIEARRPHKQHARHTRIPRVYRGPALGAEAPTDHVAAVGRLVEKPHIASDPECGLWNNHVRAVTCSTALATIKAMAMAATGLLFAFVTHFAAQTATRYPHDN